jgi:hypothetical protein
VVQVRAPKIPMKRVKPVDGDQQVSKNQRECGRPGVLVFTSAQSVSGGRRLHAGLLCVWPAQSIITNLAV